MPPTFSYTPTATGVLLLGLAGLSLLVAARLLRWALAPAGVLLRAVVGMAVVAPALGSVLVLPAAATLRAG